VFKPPWLEKRPPLAPVKPNVGSGRWIPITATLKCPLCKSDVSLELPVEKQRARYDWFGDEAFQDFRPSGNEYLLTYSLVGANRVRLPGVEEAVREFKATFLPSTPPDSWRLHMTKIWSGNKREKDPLFKEWDAADVQQFVNRFFDLIRSFDESFRIFNVSALYRQSTRKQRRLAERREVRHEAYSLLLLTVIDASTKNGVQPHFVFDSEKDREGTQVVHEWAQRAYEGSHLNLVFPYLARGIEIPEPTFVTPASRPCLEVADFVSFVVRRYCFRRLKGQSVDLDPKQLGNVHYIGFDSAGDVLTTDSTSYPWEFFYGNL